MEKPRVYANRRVLIVDDEPDIHTDFREMLSPDCRRSTDDMAAVFLEERTESFLPQFDLLHAEDGQEACEIVAAQNQRKRPIAVAYIDIRMPPGIDGIETIRRIRTLDRNVEIVLMTAYTDRPLAEIVRELELLHKLLYLRKPFAREEIQQISIALVEKWNGEQELEGRRRGLLETIEDWKPCSRPPEKRSPCTTETGARCSRTVTTGNC